MQRNELFEILHAREECTSKGQLYLHLRNVLLPDKHNKLLKSNNHERKNFGTCNHNNLKLFNPGVTKILTNLRLTFTKFIEETTEVKRPC